jgi:hypothetical protein
MNGAGLDLSTVATGVHLPHPGKTGSGSAQRHSHYTEEMRRLVLICMLLLLAVQWTWVAAAVYCEHETGAAAQHLGHHEHQHVGASDEVTKAGKAQSPANADNDCGICHPGVLCMVPEQTLALSGVSILARLDSLATFSSHIPSAPERPDR